MSRNRVVPRANTRQDRQTSWISLLSPEGAARSLCPKRALRRFAEDESGALLLFSLILLPSLILIAGFAVDIAQLNAQKSYAQGQADLAAQSAALHLHDPVEARAVARTVVRKNNQYGEIDIAESDIEFGRFSSDAGFVRDSDQSAPNSPNAVRVSVVMPWRTLLLAPLISSGEHTIRRDAVSSIGAPVVAFTLRNTLVDLDTRDSALVAPILDGLLGPGGLGLDLSLINYEGVLDTKVNVRELLDFINLNSEVDLLTFQDVLDLAISTPELLISLANLTDLPLDGIVNGFVPNGGIRIGDLIQVSDTLGDIAIEEVPFNLDVSLFDLLLATAGLASFDPSERLTVATGLNLAPLANVNLNAGIVRAPVTFIGSPEDDPPLVGSISQVGVGVTASAASILDIRADLSAADATARLIRLDCAAQEDADIVARFQIDTGAASLDLDIGLLSPPSGVDDADQSNTTPIGATTQFIDIRRDQVGVPIPIPSLITLSSLSGSVGSLLDDLRSDLNTQQSGILGSLLGGILGGLLGVLNNLISQVTALLAGSALDDLSRALLELLGLNVARAEIILESYSCVSPGGSVLVQ